MRVVQLSGRRSASMLVDDEDYEAVLAHSWYLHPGGYASRSIEVEGRHQFIYAHRWLLGLERGDERHVDHINGNKLDNRRANLRFASQSQNSQNMVRQPGASGYRNVYWHRSGNWRVQVCVEGKRVSGGYFKDLDQAAAAAAVLRKQLLPFAARDEIRPFVISSEPAICRENVETKATTGIEPVHQVAREGRRA